MPLRARGVIVNTDVAPANSNANLLIKDVIGQKEDTESGNSLYSRIYSAERHIHSYQWVYPDMATAVSLTADVGLWTPGVITTIMPANTQTLPFDIHWVHILTMSADDEYELILYADTTQIGRCVFDRSAKRDIADIPFQSPIVLPGVTIRGRLACGTGGKIANIKIMGHGY